MPGQALYTLLPGVLQVSLGITLCVLDVSCTEVIRHSDVLKEFRSGRCIFVRTHKDKTGISYSPISFPRLELRTSQIQPADTLLLNWP
jgi:hypothetical protein